MLTATPRLHPDILQHLERDGMLRLGHFLFRSGRHSRALLDRDRLLTDPAIASRMGYALAKAFFTDKIDIVAAPSIWGAGLAQWVAYFLDPKAKVVYATPQRDGTPLIAKKLGPVIAGQRILLVDNLVISGETMEQFSDAIEEMGGTVLGIGTLRDTADEIIRGHRVLGLLDEFYPAYRSEDCPLCVANEVAIERIP